MKNHVLFLLYVLLAACSHLPPTIENAPTVDISYEQVASNLKAYKNAAVRWGGVIVEVENEQYQSLIQVLLYPLNSYGRPRLDQPYSGRFVLKSPAFLDPAVYSKNAEVTVAGVLLGDMTKTVGKRSLQLPLVLAHVIHLWPKYEPNNAYYGYGVGYGGFGPYGGYYGGYRGWGYPYGGGYYSPFWGYRY